MDSAIAGNIISGMPEADYFALPRLSQSAIKKILHSPAHYKHAQDKESAAMKQGSLIDVALTEPERLDTDYYIVVDDFRIASAPNTIDPPSDPMTLNDIARLYPERLDTDFFVVPDSFRMDKRSQAYKDALMEANGRELVKKKDMDHALDIRAFIKSANGRILVKQADMDAALRVRDTVQSHPIAQQLLENVVSQQVALWTEQTDYGPVDMKARIDWANPDMNVLIDLKSTDDARAFPKKASNFGYHIQDACYRHGWQEAGGWPVDAFVFVVVEREIPHGIKLYELNQRARDLGWRQYRRGVETYAKCKQNDNWYCYDPMIDEVDLPGWSYYEDEQNGEE